MTQDIILSQATCEHIVLISLHFYHIDLEIQYREREQPREVEFAQYHSLIQNLLELSLV